jgi:hypothetical protein
MKMFLRMFLFTLLFSSILHAQGEWKQVSVMPLPVTDAQIVFHNANNSPKFYIIGGYSDVFQSAVDWIQEYDIFTNTWKTVGSLVYPRQNFSASIWDSSIVIFGGRKSKFALNPTLEKINLRSSVQTRLLDSLSINFNREYAGSFVELDTLFIIGGNTLGQPYITAFNLKFIEKTFELIYNNNETITDEMIFHKDGSLYIFGGVRFLLKKEIKVFTIKSKKLEALSTTLLELRAGGSAIYNQKLKRGFVLGGYNENKLALNSVEEIYFLSDNRIQVYKGSSLNYSRRHPMIVNYENTVFVFGGTDETGKVVSQVEQYISSVSDINDESLIPTSFSLSQNYPNPFNPETTISYKLSAVSFVDLKVYDILGNVVATLVNETQQPGMYNVKFLVNSSLSAGIYFYKLTAGDFIQAKKMLLLK